MTATIDRQGGAQERPPVSVTLEVARTTGQQARGLMYRDSLGENHGMLFPLGRPRYPEFWMKNVRLPLDMLFLDAQRRVVTVLHDVPPCTTPTCPVYTPRFRSTYVIELNAGFAERHGVLPGDRVAWTAPDRVQANSE